MKPIAMRVCQAREGQEQASGKSIGPPSFLLAMRCGGVWRRGRRARRGRGCAEGAGSTARQPAAAEAREATEGEGMGHVRTRPPLCCSVREVPVSCFISPDSGTRSVGWIWSVRFEEGVRHGKKSMVPNIHAK